MARKKITTIDALQHMAAMSGGFTGFALPTPTISTHHGIDSNLPFTVPRLENGDTILFRHNGLECHYRVQNDHLQNTGHSNAQLFHLAIRGKFADTHRELVDCHAASRKIAAEAYGYGSGAGDWPEYHAGDYDAALRLLRKLHDVASMGRFSEGAAPVLENVKADLTQLDRAVLTDDARKNIISVLKQSEKGNLIFKEWGLGDVIEYGKGMTMLFHGGPGTGKTWTAHCIAKALGKKLHEVGTDKIQSSEPGGANRAIVQAFAEASKNKAILFFDECDSLVSDRKYLGMILSSEVNTFLTELEKFEGICILATNRAPHLDPAVERRLSLMLEFKDPTAGDRVKIWQKMLPAKFPVSKKVTPEKLGEFKLTGGQIKNVLLAVARHAAADEVTEIDLPYFEAAIAQVHKQTQIIGTAERQWQAVVKT